jgi:hypothetical protein
MMPDFDPAPLAYVPTRDKTKSRARGWITLDKLPQSPKAIAVRADILDRLRQHKAEDTLPRGGRGLFYDLRPHGMPGDSRGIHYLKEYTDPKDRQSCSTEATPSYVTDQLSLMRRVFDSTVGEWLVPEDWIADNRSPDPSVPYEIANAQEAAERVVDHLGWLNLARQDGQNVYLEIRCEAANLIDRVARIAKPYGVPVYSGGGMDGLKGKKEAAERAAGRAVPTLIGHLADFDLKGGDIRDAFTEDAIAFTKWHQEYENAPGSIYIVPLGLTQEQAIAHDLLDSSGKAEVEGLPVPVLDALVREFIESHMDLEILEKVKSAETAMRADAAKIALKLLKPTKNPQ